MSAPGNRAIADQCERLAALLEIAGANPFRVRAWRNAAEAIGGLSVSLADEVASEADLTRHSHIGRDIAEAIRTYVNEGRLPPLDELAAQIPLALVELLEVEGLGPKGVKALYEQLGVQSLDDLEAAARAGRVQALKGFGAKKEQALIDAVARLRRSGPERMRLADAEGLAEPLRAWLADAPGVERTAIAGSFRRRRETVGDVDLLVVTDDGTAVMQRLVEYDAIERVVSRGTTRSTVVLDGGLQVDVRAVPAASYGAALLYFTGSKQHNVVLRQRALDRDLKLNEYGLFAGDDAVAGDTEAGLYARLDLDWIPPELREDRGEVDAAARHALPGLVSADAIRGNLHGHTDWSDGRAPLETMVDAARERGHAFIAITDHGPRVRVANGLDADRLRAQADAIDTVAAERDDIAILKGVEVDILADGSLDLPDDVLARLDVVVCSIHYELRRSRAEQTERVLRAMDNPHFMIWGHPTAREINRREGIDIDLDRCLAAAAERGIAIEINAQPKRLDLDDVHARKALDHGCRLSINTDAHRPEHFDLIGYGVDQARRAWASADDVINTRGVADLRRILRSRD